MDNFKIKLSDIFKYILLGLIEVIVFLAVLGFDRLSLPLQTTSNIKLEIPEDSERVTLAEAQDIIDIAKTIIITVIPIATLVVLYVIGYITQSIILLLYGGRFLGTGIYEVAQFIRHNSRWLSNEDKYPDWVHWSDCPGKVINAYKENIEVSNDAENKTEFLYANQLFQGVAFTLVIASLYSFEGCIGKCLIPVFLISLWIANRFSKNSLTPYIFAGVICLVIAVLPYFLTNGKSNGHWWAIGLAASLIFAVQLAKTQIQRFGIIAKDSNDDTFKRILGRFGMPKAYILIRAHQVKYLEDALKSVAEQDYPNTKVILLIDKNTRKYEQKDIINLAETYRTERGINIVNCTSLHSGPAALAYEIRDIFLKSANDDDIAIMLDSDDLFYSKYTVSRIMAKTLRTDSDICLLAFEIFGETSLNFARNTHNDLVKEIATTKAFWTPEQLEKEKGIHHISTIGWTKCYRKHMVKFYQELLSEYYHDNKGPYAQHTKYEDFPDIVNLVRKDIRICAVEKISILFRKREESTTTGIKWDNYCNQIPYFLKLCASIYNKAHSSLIKDAEGIIIKRLIPYKFVQYYNILLTSKNVRDRLLLEDSSLSAPEGKFHDICISNGAPSKATLSDYLSSKDIERDLSIFDLDKDSKTYSSLI